MSAPTFTLNVNPASQILFAIDCQLSSTHNRLHGRVYKTRTALPAFTDICFHRCLHDRVSRYLADHLIPASNFAPRRLRLRSANVNRLTVPRCRLSTYGFRALYHAGRNCLKGQAIMIYSQNVSYTVHISLARHTSASVSSCLHIQTTHRGIGTISTI